MKTEISLGKRSGSNSPSERYGIRSKNVSPPPGRGGGGKDMLKVPIDRRQERIKGVPLLINNKNKMGYYFS